MSTLSREIIMRAYRIALAVLVLTAAPLFGAPDVAGLAGEDEKVRFELSGSVDGKAESESALVAALAGENATAAKMARQTLFELVQQVAGGPDADAVAAALAAELDKHNLAARREICHLLSYLGTSPSAVQAVAAKLADKDLREDARMALTGMAGAQATAALVAALASADEPFKVAIINGLGEKGDPTAVGPLVELTASDRTEIRQAAWQALARLASPDALNAFKQAVQEKKDPFVIGLLFDYADALLSAGRLQEADVVLKLRAEAGPLDELDQCRMMRAHARLGTPDSISIIMRGLNEKNPRLRGAAYEAAAILPGTEVTRLITQKMIAAQGAEKIELLELLGKRGRQMDDRTVMLMYMAMLDKDDAVKVACIRAMQEAEITATLPTLLNLVRGPAGPVADAAEQALSRLSDPSVTTEVIQTLQSSTPEGKARLLRVLGNRQDPAALSVAMNAAHDPEAMVREAALRCLGRLAAEEAYETLLAAFDAPPGPERDAAEEAMSRLTSDLITARLLSGYFDCSERQKPSLLRVLAGRPLAAIEALLLSEMTSPDEAIREAAVTGLGRRGTPAAAEALLAAAKAGPPKITEEALSGYLNIAATIEFKDPAQAASMYVEVLKSSTRPDLKQKALGCLSRVGDPAVEDHLAVATALMSDEKLGDTACLAVVAMARRMSDSRKDTAIDLLKKVLDKSGNRDVKRIAAKRLQELGVAVDPAVAE